MLFGGVEVGNCCSHRNANAEGSCQALIRIKGIHRSDPRFPVPADEPHATSLPTAGWWVWETASGALLASSLRLSLQHFFIFMIFFPLLSLFWVLLWRGWVRALSSRRFNPSPLPAPLRPPLSNCSFFKSPRVKVHTFPSQGKLHFVLICVRQHCSFVGFFSFCSRASHLHSRAANSFCLKSCLSQLQLQGTKAWQCLMCN